MSIKSKLLSCISMFLLMLGVLILGVLAVGTQTITLDGSVNFNVADKSLWVKSVSISNDNYTEEPLADFMPGYINSNFNLNISDQINTYGAFTLHYEIVNTTTTAYSVSVAYSGAVSGVSVTALPEVIQASSAEITEITSTTPTTQLDIMVTNPNGENIDLSDITITIEEDDSQFYIHTITNTTYGTTTGDGNYEVGDEVVLSASFLGNQDLEFIGWKANGENGDLLTDRLDYSFTLTEDSPTYYYAHFQTLNTEELSFIDDMNNEVKVSPNVPVTTSLIIPSTIYMDGQVKLVTTVEYFENFVVEESLYLPSTLKTIAEEFLYSDITELYYNIEGTNWVNEAYDFYADAFCESTIDKLIIGPNVKILPDNILIGWSGIYISPAINEVVFVENSQLEIIGENFMFDNGTYTTLTIPEGVISIGDGSFYNNESLISVSLPSTLQVIENAFASCNNLQYNVDTYGVKFLGNNDNPYLLLFSADEFTGESYQTPEGCKLIRQSAFSSNTNISSITISPDVIYIGSVAFSNCTSLTEINYNATSATCPVVTGDDTNNLIFYNAGQNGNGITLNIGANVESLPSGLFWNNYTSISNKPKITLINVESDDIYLALTSESSCGELISALEVYGDSIRILKSVVESVDPDFKNNTYLNGDTFSRSEENNYYVYTIV